VNLVVYTTVFGQTDKLREPTNPGSARFVVFTDQDITSKRWEIVMVPTLAAPKRECRKYKQLSHVVFPDADATLWVDAQFHLSSDPLDLLATYPAELTGFRHHKRKRITDECEAIIRAGKAKPEAVRAQLAAYKADGWDTDDNPQAEITNGGVLLRRHAPRVIRFNELWHAEVQARTLRDQMSIDYCAAKVGLEIAYFPGNMVANPIGARIHYPS
jgi:hypothetical protein